MKQFSFHAVVVHFFLLSLVWKIENMGKAKIEAANVIEKGKRPADDDDA